MGKGITLSRQDVLALREILETLDLDEEEPQE